MKRQVIGAAAAMSLATTVLGFGIQAFAQSASQQPTFFPSHFKGMGDLALIYGNNGLHVGQLYTLVNTVVDGRNIVSTHHIAHNVVGATFSPNGKWLAVTVQAGQWRALWLVSSSGSQRQKLGNNLGSTAWMPGGSEFLYSHGKRAYKIAPGSQPVSMPLRLPADSRVQGFSVSSAGRRIALDVTMHANNRAWYDEIGLWNTQSGRFSPLVKATVPNGLIVGPFTGNGQSLFYWDDPDHSASVQADGLTLHSVTMSGRTQTVGHTFASGGFMPAGVQVFGSEQAVVWQTHSRYLFDPPKTISIWHGRPIPAIASGVELFPSISPDGRSIAFVYGKADPTMRPGPRGIQWLTSLKLATYPLATGRLTAITSAGAGVSNPLFNQSGSKILFTRQNDVLWTRADNRGSAVPVAVLPGTALQGYPQYGILYSVQIADYLPSPK